MIRPFIPQDMIDILRSGVKESPVKLAEDAYGLTDQIRQMAEQRQGGITCEVDGNVVGCGGLEVIGDGVGVVWLLVNEVIDKFPKTAYRHIKEGIENLIKEAGVKRVQAWCRSENTQGHNLLSHLGFRNDGLVENYTLDGADCILYSKETAWNRA